MATRSAGALIPAADSYADSLIQSREDPRVAPSIAERAFASLGATDKRLVWTEGAGHIITVDYGRERVFEEVSTWLSAHM